MNTCIILNVQQAGRVGVSSIATGGAWVGVVNELVKGGMNLQVA